MDFKFKTLLTTLTHSPPPNAILVTLAALFLVLSLHLREGEGTVHKQLTGWISDTLKR